MKKTVKKSKTERRAKLKTSRRPKASARKSRSFDFQKWAEKLVGGEILKFRFGRPKKSTPAPLKWMAGIFTIFLVVIVGWSLIKSIELDNSSKITRKVSQISTSTAPQKGPLGKQFQFAAKLDFPTRITYWTTYFWQKQQTVDLLKTVGVGPKIADTAPLIPNKFDCTTFVETVAAMALSNSPAEFYSHLTNIRYRDGKTDYVSRNHFPELDWIPNNESAGYIKDVTAQIAKLSGVEVKQEAKTIDRGTWVSQQLKKEGRSVASVQDYSWNTKREAKVTYIPITDVQKVLKNIPNGAVLNVVRAESSAYPTIITHQGYVVKKNDVLFVDHAYPTGKIRTIPLATYLKNILSKKDQAEHPVIGLNFNQFVASN
ncbi:MAG: N-acetylmuramoyl-L-alanine amidase-like domain-containing protein [Bdellovibrionota bacterium]